LLEKVGGAVGSNNLREKGQQRRQGGDDGYDESRTAADY